MAVSKERMTQIAMTCPSKIIDDHSGEEVSIAAVCVVSIGDERHHVVPLFANTSHCLNAMNNAGGVWRQTKQSVSGMVDTRGVSIEEAIENFNHSYREGDLSGDVHRLTLVTAF